MARRHGPDGTTASFKLAMGAASLFILVAATLGLLLDRNGDRAATWTLRGSLGPDLARPAAQDRAPVPARV